MSRSELPAGPAPKPRPKWSLCCCPWPPTLTPLPARAGAPDTHHHNTRCENDVGKQPIMPTFIEGITRRFSKQSSRRVSTAKRAPGQEVTETISAYRLNWSDLERKLYTWYPHANFQRRMTVDGDQYVIYLKHRLRSHQREEINRLRDGEVFARETTPEN